MKPYLLLVFAVEIVTVTARPWSHKGWIVIVNTRGGSDHVNDNDKSEKEEYFEESEPEVPMHWESEDNLTDMDDVIDALFAESAEEEFVDDEADKLLPESDEDDHPIEPEMNKEQEINQAIIQNNNNIDGNESDQPLMEPEDMDDNNNNNVIDDNVKDDPSLAAQNDDSAANINSMDLADAYNKDKSTEPEPIVVSSPSKTPIIVDAVMRRTLIQDLKYRRREVKFMKPEIATLVAQKQLHRPVEGVPPHWLVSTAPPKSRVRTIVAVSLTVLAMIIASQTLDVTNVDLGNIWKRRPMEVSTTGTSDPVDPFDLLIDETEDESTTTATNETKDINEHVNALGDEHPHSIKPGQHSVNDNLDVTWLDKCITAIERKIQAFFRMKL